MDKRDQSQEIMPSALNETPSTTTFPVVGIGASAGGLRALQELLTHTPADSGMAFVIILHLSPDYESNLGPLLQHHTQMPVTQVTETVHVEANHVYVIPPRYQLSMDDSTIRLSTPANTRSRHAAIDLFFRTLAETHDSYGVAVVLSGSGTDGTMGLQRIKERGGLTIVQEPREAEFDSMPRSAIATGLVDFVLPVAMISDTIIGYWRNAQTIRLPVLDAPSPDTSAKMLRDIFVVLRTRTGHDFSQYKHATVLRRIGRRMQVNSVADLSAYLNVLRARPNEVQALLRDLLISVTNFFRDMEAWHTLETVIPNLFITKAADDQLRVWVTACATGEEAYSVAMLLREYASTLDVVPQIQVFATDIDEDAIAVARQGIYPETIVADVSPTRLQRFFIGEQNHYRIKEELRDMVLFATHNLLRDPPFSRLDLITCRNVLIYLNREVQEQVLQLFHFTLRPDSYLLLGASETTDSTANLFTEVDKSQRLFQRRAVPPAAMTLAPNLPLVGLRRRALVAERINPVQGVRSFSELDIQLLTRYAPASVIINEAYEIVHLARGAGRFLLLSDGEPSHDLLKVIHPSIRLDLRTALLAATQGNTQAEINRVHMDVDGTPRLVNIIVQSIKEPPWARGYLLVIFNDVADANDVARLPTHDAEPVVRQLEEELQRKRQQLRNTIEQYETSVEEHKAANEELQAINEELRATTEELETSKEELQSVNEELITVNQELKYKVEEVSQTNNDLQNLMASTDIGTIFVDRNLHIKRNTPSAQKIFNLIPSDINRPLAHVTHKLRYDGLPQDTARVLNTREQLEREVESVDGRWYLARLQPYRTNSDHIDGVVLTFVEITARKQMEETVRASEERFRAIVSQTLGGIAETDLTGHFTLVNNRYCDLLGFTQHELLGMQIEDVIHTDDWARTHALFDRTVTEGVPFTLETQYVRKDGSNIWIQNDTSVVRDASGRPFATVTVAMDITERKQVEESLRQARDYLEARVNERTFALGETNATLQAEIARRIEVEQARQDVQRRLVSAQEEERRRISRELHDQLGQSLTALRLGLATLASTEPPSTPSDMVMRLQALASQIDEDVDRLALELRPSVLDDLGLVAALQQHIDDWAHTTHIAADFQIVGSDDYRLPSEIEIVLYRVVQEALTNVLKHADAQQVSVVLEHRPEYVMLIIEDNGRGFELETGSARAKEQRGLGLIGMHERITMVGGTLTVESAPEQGTTLYIRIQFAPMSPKETLHG